MPTTATTTVPKATPPPPPLPPPPRPAIQQLVWGVTACIALTFGITGIVAFMGPGDVAAVAEDRSFDYVSFDITRDGNTIVFCSTTCDLFTYNLVTKKITRLTNTKDEAESLPNLSPDDKSVVYAWQRNNDDHASIHLMSLDGKVKKQLTNHSGAGNSDGASDNAPSFSQDGKKITFLRSGGIRDYAFGGEVRNKHDVYMMDRSGGSVERLTTGNYYMLDSPRFYNKDQSVLFIQFMPEGVGQPSIYQVDIASKKVSPWINLSTGSRTVTATGLHVADASDFAVAISSRRQEYVYDIALMNAKTGTVVDLNVANETMRRVESPVLTSDGKYVYYLAPSMSDNGEYDRFDLCRVDVATKKRRKLADKSLFDR